jgi:hypothetical protein
MDRPIDGQQTDRQTDCQMHRHTCINRQMAEGEADTETERYTNRQTD